MSETTIYSTEGYPIRVSEDGRGVPKYRAEGSNISRGNMLDAVIDHETLNKI